MSHKNASMQHSTLTDNKGYGPAWSTERPVKEQSVKETNKHIIISYGYAYVSTLSK